MDQQQIRTAAYRVVKKIDELKVKARMIQTEIDVQVASLAGLQQMCSHPNKVETGRKEGQVQS